MTIEIRCPNGHPLQVKDEFAGKVGLCPHCHAKVQVPFASQVRGESQAPLDESVHQAPQDKESGPGSSILLKKGKLCVECGRTVSQSFSICPQCAAPLPNYRHLKMQKEGNAIEVRFDTHRFVDDATVKEIAEELSSVADRASHYDLVLDLSHVVSLSSQMLGKLVMLHKKLQRDVRRLRICHVGSELREVLAAMKLDQILDIEEDKTTGKEAHP